MKTISFALIAMGIIMGVIMSDATAAILCIMFGVSIPVYNALAAWRKRTKCDNVKILNFVDALLSEE